VNEYTIKKIRLILSTIVTLLASFVLFFMFKNQMSNIYLKIIFWIVTLGFIIKNNFEDLIELLDTKNKNNENIFNIYYINFPKVFELAMLIDNKLKTNIEKTYRNEQSNKNGGSVNLKSGALGASISDEDTNTKTFEYREVQEVKNTNSIFLRDVLEKCKEVECLNTLNNGDLIKITDVKLSIINLEEILQISSMVSGILNGNTINADAGDSSIKINLNALSNILLKDYKYEFFCENKGHEKFYISVPMKLNKEFENEYSIFDLEIGNVDVVGIYRTNNYKPNNKSTWDYLQSIKNNNLTEELEASSKSDNIEKPKELESYPYIDLVAIIQNVNFKNGVVNE